MSATIEERLFRSFWDDGLIDLFAGAGVLIVGLSWQLDLAVLGAVAPALLVPLWAATRRRLIEPRSGYAEFAAPRRARLQRGRWGALLIGLLAFVLGVVLYLFVTRRELEVGLESMVPALPALLLALGAAVSARAFSLPRFAVYSIVLAIAGAVTVVAGLHPAPSMIAGGLVAALTGASLLARFLRANPKPEVTS